jgi:Gram-negative bacterial TonB protein C-terminal
MKIRRRIFLPSLFAGLLTTPREARPSPVVLGVHKFKIPEYPNIFRKMYVQGSVSARAHVLGNGTVDSVSILSGPEQLHGTVIDALKEWVFVAVNQDESDVDITFAFILEENKSDICLFQVSGTVPNRIEIRANYGTRME